VTLTTMISALQLFLAQHPTGGAACILMPERHSSISRNDIRAIAQAVARHEVILVMGDPIPTTPQNARLSAQELLKQLASLPGEWLKRSVFISRGREKVDEHYSVEIQSAVQKTGTVTGPEGELFLLAGNSSQETPEDWLNLYRKDH
jgi:hypothetical protein